MTTYLIHNTAKMPVPFLSHSIHLVFIKTVLVRRVTEVHLFPQMTMMLQLMYKYMYAYVNMNL